MDVVLCGCGLLIPYRMLQSARLLVSDKHFIYIFTLDSLEPLDLVEVRAPRFFAL